VDDHAGNERYRIASLSKGLHVLRVIGGNASGASLSALSSQTDIPTATLFRILATLEAEGYVVRDADGAYAPATAILELGFASLRASGIVGVSTGPIRDLSRRTGETANLGVLRHDRVLYLIRVRNQDLVTAHLDVGSTLPATSTSMGKVLLAALDKPDLDQRLNDRSFSGATGVNALDTRGAFDRQLDAVRRAGYAIQDEEIANGLRSVAVPVRNQDGTAVAAVNVAVSARRMSVEALISDILPEVQDTASRISRLLGCPPEA